MPKLTKQEQVEINAEKDVFLISAAPELLEALKSAQHFIGNGAVNMAGAWRDSVLDQIEDAIAKAEGGQK